MPSSYGNGGSEGVRDCLIYDWQEPVFEPKQPDFRALLLSAAVLKNKSNDQLYWLNHFTCIFLFQPHHTPLMGAMPLPIADEETEAQTLVSQSHSPLRGFRATMKNGYLQGWGRKPQGELVQRVRKCSKTNGDRSKDMKGA